MSTTFSPCMTWWPLLAVRAFCVRGAGQRPIRLCVIASELLRWIRRVEVLFERFISENATSLGY